MRICFLTHYYPPEVGAPQARISALARSLSERGASVTVQTGFPHYPDGVIRPPYSNRPYLIERDGPVKVVRTAVYPAPNRGFARRLLDHASLATSAVAGAPLSGPADVVVCESPPLFLAGAAIAFARIKRAPLLLNVADRWPASAVELGALTDRRAIRAAEWLERAAYRSAAAISVPTEGLVDDLRLHPDARDKVVRLGPSVDVERFDPGPIAPGARLRVLYAGTVGLAQGLDTLVEAARRAGPDAVEVTVAGDGADAPILRERIERERIEAVRMVGSVAHREVPRLYAEADAAVVLLRDRPIFAGALPTKLLEAMAAGRAIVLSARGESARLVEGAGAGVVVPPEDPEALAGAFRELAGDAQRLRSLGAAGRRAAVERFSRERLVSRWWTLLQELCDGGHPLRRSGPAAETSRDADESAPRA
jgi:glycosyltransferase involved in cell wall biosynthesis